MSDSVDRILAQWATVRPELDVSAMGVLGRLSRLTRLVERAQSDVFEAHGLQPGEFDILATLLRTDAGPRGLTAGALTDSAMVTSGAITNRLDRLVTKGFISRETDPENRRTIRVALTGRGAEAVEGALAAHIENEERLLAALTDNERDQLAALLSGLLATHEGSAAHAE
ncbi:MarR family winged helix-turn-helix transcriptional regulator [Salinibacterium sp. M195]|uniref:MarR family winged helix-turn-helix transcriptional regulator n=1 Tax=Salinibacterium sp. M195 TaxID=2583374 RepID=UPI001C62CC75|nr:MarR family transcriptional regulator [Salinibacterium sp. M195]QYH36665.1 MarR family transcriptional regulator [Salinibacterium sp. M195]